jgi:succinate dehydrogenase/fumarate reductase cytochrome b subunit
MNKIIRPLAPNLTLKKPQLTSTFPISNRISGAAATLVLLSPILCLKIGFLNYTEYNVYLFFFFVSKLILSSLVHLTYYALLYHVFNGLNQIFRSLDKKKGK